MGGKLTKHAFEGMITQDIEWLMKQPRTLERTHIVQILEKCAEHYYPPPVISPECTEEDDDNYSANQ